MQRGNFMQQVWGCALCIVAVVASALVFRFADPLHNQQPWLDGFLMACAAILGIVTAVLVSTHADDYFVPAAVVVAFIYGVFAALLQWGFNDKLGQHACTVFVAYVLVLPVYGFALLVMRGIREQYRRYL